MAEETEVKTTMVVVNEASGPLAQVEKSGNAAAIALGNVEKTVVSATVRPTAGGAPVAATKAGGGAGIESAEDKARQALLEEARERKFRIKTAKFHEAKGQILEKAVGSSAGILIDSQTAFGGVLGKLSGTAESIGYSMTAFGGSMGATGQKLIGLAGKAVVLGAAFEAGYAIGTKMDQAAEHFLGLSISDALAGVRSQKEQDKANQKYAEAQGFRTAAEMGAVRSVQQTMGNELRLARAASEGAKQLKAMPTDPLSDAMGAWRVAALEQARKMAQPGDDIAALHKAIMEAGAHRVWSMTNQSNHEAMVAESLKEQAQKLASLVPGQDATLAQTEAYHNAQAIAISGMLAHGQLLEADAASAMEKLAAQAEQIGSIKNNTAEFLKQEQTNIALEQEETDFIKQLKKTKGAFANTAEGGYKLNAAIAKWSADRATKLGLTPEQHKQLQTGAKTKADMAKVSHINDFRGSRFDIKQNFAEGFDPDRIAVAFANDLHKLGTNKSSSGARPLGASTGG